MSENPVMQPPLDAEFAERVLDAVDNHIARRRYFRGLMATSGLCVVLAATAFWRDRAATTVTAPQTTASAAQARPPMDETADSAADPLSYMFPDAEPLARYTAEDSGPDDRDTDALFDDQEPLDGG